MRTMMLSALTGALLMGVCFADNKKEHTPDQSAAAAKVVYPPVDVPLESLPEAVVASMEVRARFLGGLASPGEGMSFVVEDNLRWAPGSTVTVAFMGGNAQLHRDIEDATKQITDNANLKLDFGFNPTTGTYRTWSTNDQTYKADIRVSFDQSGYWSLVGRDSVDSSIGNPSDPSGGRPNQRSLNLGGFHLQRPTGWKGTTRHEFMHAVAFHHEHQHPSAVCDNEFRWQDDPGYIPTTDARGMYITDPNGNRPGIYTYLAGYPNNWSRRKVDHNLRALSPDGLTSSHQIDQDSIMLYRFPQLFYRRDPSPCAPTGGGEELSAGDKDGLKHLYPSDPPAVTRIIERQRALFNRVLKEEKLPQSIKESFRYKLYGVEKK